PIRILPRHHRATTLLPANHHTANRPTASPHTASLPHTPNLRRPHSTARRLNSIHPLESPPVQQTRSAQDMSPAAPFQQAPPWRSRTSARASCPLRQAMYPTRLFLVTMAVSISTSTPPKHSPAA